MSRLAAAHYEYNHQDCITAYALGSLLLPRTGNKNVIVDKKAVDNDRFDDSEIVGAIRRRVQIKSHEVSNRQLQLIDFTTGQISFRIDDAINSFTRDPNPAEEYRLFTTFGSPEANLLPFLNPAPKISPLLSGLTTQRFKLNSAAIWPKNTLFEKPLPCQLIQDFSSSLCA